MGDELTGRGVRVIVPWYDQFDNVRGWVTGWAGPVVKASPPGRDMRPVEVHGRVYWHLADLVKTCPAGPARWPRLNGEIRFGHTGKYVLAGQ